MRQDGCAEFISASLNTSCARFALTSIIVPLSAAPISYHQYNIDVPSCARDARSISLLHTHRWGLLHEVANFVQQPFLCAPSTACAVPLPRDNGEGLG